MTMNEWLDGPRNGKFLEACLPGDQPRGTLARWRRSECSWCEEPARAGVAAKGFGDSCEGCRRELAVLDMARHVDGMETEGRPVGITATDGCNRWTLAMHAIAIYLHSPMCSSAWAASMWAPFEVPRAVAVMQAAGLAHVYNGPQKQSHAQGGHRV
jgi:hypothetical protein